MARYIAFNPESLCGSLDVLIHGLTGPVLPLGQTMRENIDFPGYTLELIA
jgi:hypothetical protein